MHAPEMEVVDFSVDSKIVKVWNQVLYAENLKDIVVG